MLVRTDVGRLKDQLIRAFRHVDPHGFVSPLAGKIFMQTKAQLPHMNPDRTVFGGTITTRLPENSSTNPLLSQVCWLSLKRVFRKIAKQSRKSM